MKKKNLVIISFIIFFCACLALGVFLYTNNKENKVDDKLTTGDITQKEDNFWKTYEADNLGLSFKYFQKENNDGGVYSYDDSAGYEYVGSLPENRAFSETYFSLKVKRVQDIDSCKNIISIKENVLQKFNLVGFTVWKVENEQQGNISRCLLSDNKEVFYLNLNWLPDQYSEDIIENILSSFEKTKNYNLEELGYLPVINKTTESGILAYNDIKNGVSFEYWGELGMPNISLMQIKSNLPRYGTAISFPSKTTIFIYNDDYAKSSTDLSSIVITKDLKTGLDQESATKYFSQPESLYYINDLKYVKSVNIKEKSGYKILGGHFPANSQSLIMYLMPNFFSGQKFNNVYGWILPENFQNIEYTENQIKEIMENTNNGSSVNVLEKIIGSLEVN